MSFLKKLSETVKDTASSIGIKSMDMVETGKLKLQRTQLEAAIKEKKTEIGDLIYTAQKETMIVETDNLKTIFDTINALENQIMAIDEKLHKEEVLISPQPTHPQDIQDASTTLKVFCSKCGQELCPGAKFCSGCGESQ
jgi:hypothetical protein